MRSGVYKAGWLILGVAVLFIFSGCSVNPVSSSWEESSEPDPGLTTANDFHPADLTGGPDLNIVNVTFTSSKIHQKIIDSVGGTIEIPILSDTCKLVVPPGAVSKKKNIGVSVTQGFNSAGEKITIFALTPGGYNFNIPAVLEHKVSCQTGSPVELWWDNPNDTSVSYSISQATTAQNQHCTFSIAELSTFVVWESNLQPAQDEVKLPQNKLTQRRYVNYK